jgi:hypothetical protein
MVWRITASLASPSKTGWRISASLASPTLCRKRPFWRVLKFAKFAGEWPLLSMNTFLGNHFNTCLANKTLILQQQFSMHNLVTFLIDT